MAKAEVDYPIPELVKGFEALSGLLALRGRDRNQSNGGYSCRMSDCKAKYVLGLRGCESFVRMTGQSRKRYCRRQAGRNMSFASFISLLTVHLSNSSAI